jgi:hypothetical protein
MIASGPVSPDTATCEQALSIVEKYRLRLSEKAMECLKTETPKETPNAFQQVTGSVRELCRAAERACQEMGYQTVFLSDQLSCEAREAGRFMASILRSHYGDKKKIAIIKADDTPGNIRQVYSGEEGDVSLDIRSMKKLISHSGEDSVLDALSGDYEKVIFEDIFSDKTEEDVYKKIKECDAAVIIARAGAHNGKKIERLLEQLSRQDIKPVAFALAGEDEWLIRSYYGK